MINVHQYFSLNRTLLLIVGLWPYNKSKFARFQLICCFSFLITSIIFQITTFVTSKFTSELMIKVLSFTFPMFSLTIKYNSFCVNSGTIKCLMEQLQQFCNDLRDNNEIAIVKRYGSNAKRYTKRLTMLIASLIFISTFAQLWPDFHDIFLSINKSRTHHLHIENEYFIDQERYFYLLLLHINASFYIGLLSLLATGTMLIAYLQYACGMFTIASYRIKNTMKVYTMLQCNNFQNKNLVCKSIIYAVNIHRKAIKFSQYLITNFEISFMLLIVSGVITLSLNILRTLQIVTTKFNFEEFSTTVLITLISVVYMFLSNFFGQEITDHYNYLFVAAYNVPWYNAPIHIQRLILLLMQRGNKSFGLNVGGLFVASLQCFATLMNTSLSYFTVMYSVQK
ncbi:uncharacterized protein [Anoplolepis gracilipes]|uniref:uncharacterized protein n=1 Tax=Anoplolepis gracilipes TaxID=354296 RepID=UPI003BA17E60